MNADDLSRTTALAKLIGCLLEQEQGEFKEWRHKLLNAVQTVYSSVEMMQVTPGLTPSQKTVLKRMEEGADDLEKYTKCLLDNHSKTRDELRKAIDDSLAAAGGDICQKRDVS